MYTREELQKLLNLINTYNETPTLVIKSNLKRILKERNKKTQDIIKLGFNAHLAYSWTGLKANRLMFNDALLMAIAFDFNIEELLKNI